VERGFHDRLKCAIHVFAKEQRDWQAVKTPSVVRTTRCPMEATSKTEQPKTSLPSSSPTFSLAELTATRVKLERANAVHNLLVKTMAACLSAGGRKPFFNDLLSLA
jgi:hypothetical protein